MVECVLASLTDEFSSVIRKTRTRTYVFRFVCCALFCCCGLPFVTNVSKLKTRNGFQGALKLEQKKLHRNCCSRN